MNLRFCATAVAMLLGACADQHYASLQDGNRHTQAAAIAAPQRAPRAVPIEYYDGQPLVRIRVGQIATFRCIIDTGSSDLVVPWPVMKKLFDSGMGDADVAMVGTNRAVLAGGSVIKTVDVVFSEIGIGPMALRGVPASVIPSGSCLFGMSVLKQFGHAAIDFASQRLVLED